MYSKISTLIFLVVLLSLPITIFAADVVLNEFQVEPSGASQWVELYNLGSSSVDISGWFIDDDGGTERFTIPNNTILAPNNCISFQSGNFNWNTSSSDSAKLLSGSAVVDGFSFSGSPGSGVSYGRTPDGTGGWTTFASSSRDKLNTNGVSCLAPTPTLSPTPTPTNTPIPTNTSTPSNTPTPTTPPPTETPTPTLAPTANPTPTKTPTPTVRSTPVPTPTREATISGEVLAVSDTAIPTPLPQETTGNNLRPLIIAFAFIGAGLALLAFLLVWKKTRLIKFPVKSDDILTP